MNIEAVSICVDYDDFLDVTAEQNKGLFNRWVIVTTPKDVKTREVCRRHNLEIILTEDFYKINKNEFAKARGINRGLAMLSKDAWRVHIDADIVLPPIFRNLLSVAHLSENCIYGCDRVMLNDYGAWLKYKATHVHHSHHYKISVPNNLGVRWASSSYGWVPIGYFQMWHSDADEWNGIRQRRYPENHNNAARNDVQFALQWDRRERIFLPELIVAHLDSGQSKLGANWSGRTTKRFGPDLKPDHVGY